MDLAVKRNDGGWILRKLGKYKNMFLPLCINQHLRGVLNKLSILMKRVRLVFKETTGGRCKVWVEVDGRSPSGKRRRCHFRTEAIVDPLLYKDPARWRRQKHSSLVDLSIEEKKMEVHRLLRELDEKYGRECTVDEVILARDKRNKPPKCLITLINDYLDSRPDMKFRYREKFANLSVRLSEYLDNRKVYLHEVDQDFLDGFRKWLNQYQEPSTINKTLEFLRTILLYYQKKGMVLTGYSGLKFTKPVDEKDMITLTPEMLEKLETVDLPDELILIKDLSCIMALTGLRFSDVAKISKVRVKNDLLLAIPITKTGKMATVPIYDKLRKYLEKYDYEIVKLKTSNQRFNILIKEVFKLAGFNEDVIRVSEKGGIKKETVVPFYKRVTSHTFRRSFITSLSLYGVSHDIIKLITAHSTVRQVEKYVHVSQKQLISNIEVINKVWK
jgi:integrase